MSDAVLSDGFDVLNASAFEQRAGVHSTDSQPVHQLNIIDDDDDDGNASDRQQWNFNVDRVDDAELAAITANTDTVDIPEKEHNVAVTSSSIEPTAVIEQPSERTSSSAIVVEPPPPQPEAPIVEATPKYHRRSHDERQLPAVVRTDRAIPWYHHLEDSQHQPQQQQPNESPVPPHTHRTASNNNTMSNVIAPSSHVLPSSSPLKVRDKRTITSNGSNSNNNNNNNNHHYVHRTRGGLPHEHDPSVYRSASSFVAAAVATHQQHQQMRSHSGRTQMSQRGFMLSPPDYGESDGVPPSSAPGSSHSSGASGGGRQRQQYSAANNRLPTVVYRRHREHPLAAMTTPVTSSLAASKSNAVRIISNNNKSETDSSDGNETAASSGGVQRKVLSSDKRRRSARNADRDSSGE